MTTPLSQAGVDIGRRLGRMSTAVRDGRRDTLNAAGLVGKREHAAVIKRDSGGDSRLSRVGRRGARVGARYDIRGDSVQVRATGPLHFLANPMSPHRIPKAHGRRRGPIFIPGVGVRAWAQHPGTPGKNTWRTGQQKAQPKMVRATRAELANQITRAFG